MATINVIEVTNGFRVSFSYDPALVTLIKSLPSSMRKWIPDKKAWLVESVAMPTLVAKLNSYGHTVWGYEPPAAPPPPRASASASTNWAESMFLAVPADRREAVYKALSRVLHPDLGGNLQAMQALNEGKRRVDG